MKYISKAYMTNNYFEGFNNPINQSVCLRDDVKLFQVMSIIQTFLNFIILGELDEL